MKEFQNAFKLFIKTGGHFSIVALNTVALSNTMEYADTLPDGIVDLIVTSPPFWMLREYLGKAEVWGGKRFRRCPQCKQVSDGEELLCYHPQNKECYDLEPYECTHEWMEHFTPARGGKNHPDRPSSVGANRVMSESVIRGEGYTSYYCKWCDAWKGHLGLEPEPNIYVSNLTSVFGKYWRVLKDTGSLWLNIGDTYAANRTWGQVDGKVGDVGNWMSVRVPEGVKPKDLVGIPWRLAMSLQAAGWYWRAVVPWLKWNIRPESAKDRPTIAHEYFLVLTKQESYYYDREAIREQGHYRRTIDWYSDSIDVIIENLETLLHELSTARYDMGKYGALDDENGVVSILQNTKPFKQAHHAVFPQELIRPIIKACCPSDGVVLDPFMGSGTTAVVSTQEGRDWLGCDTSEKYVRMAIDRAETEGLLRDSSVMDF